MKKENVRVFLEWVLAISIACAIGYMVLRMFILEQKPLSNADIPQETVDFFKGLIDGGSDIGGILGPDHRDSSDWHHYESLDDMKFIEDEYFVIYYSAKDSVVERNKALIAQKYAHEAIPKAEKFMKTYPYSSMQNGRKLPIYLANTPEDLPGICKQLGFMVGRGGAVGYYLFSYGISGTYTNGIVISPKAWDVPDILIGSQTEDKEFRSTLWHEMNHFIYFSNLDYVKVTMPHLWFTEGLAEFFSENYNRMLSVRNHNKYDLKRDIRDGAEYWVGMSAFMCLEKQYQKEVVSDLVVNSYTNSLEKALRVSVPSGGSLSAWDREWHIYMTKKEYLHHE